MFARITRFDVRSERLREGRREIEEHVLPALEMQAGYGGVLLLADPESGKMISVTLWEDEQKMHATDEAAQWFRTFGAEAVDGSVTDVDTYEVYISQFAYPRP
jgi:heme-degrading monooxygenase HmoA